MRSKRLFVQKARVRAERLNPAGTAVPAAPAKKKNRNNNDEKYLDIHGVQAFQRDGFRLLARALPKSVPLHFGLSLAAGNVKYNIAYFRGFGLNPVDGFRDEFLTQARQPQIHAKRVDLHESHPLHAWRARNPAGLHPSPAGRGSRMDQAAGRRTAGDRDDAARVPETRVAEAAGTQRGADCRVYARAAAWIAGADRWSGAKWRGLEDQLGPAPGQTDGNRAGDEPAPMTAGLLARASPATGTRRSTWLAVDKG